MPQTGVLNPRCKVSVAAKCSHSDLGLIYLGLEQVKGFYLDLWRLCSLCGPLALPFVEMLLAIGSLA